MRLRYFAAVVATLCVALTSAPAVAKTSQHRFGPNTGDGDDFGTSTVGDGTACVAGSALQNPAP